MNKKIFQIIVFTSLAVSGALLYAGVQDMNRGNQTHCPVMGHPVNQDIYSDFQGQRIFFCCQGCVETFNKDPEKYVKKMKENGIQPLKLKKQQHCPVSGEAINDESYVDVKGKRVYVCCDGCRAKVKDNPEKYFKKVADMGEYLEDLKEDKR